jgi:hypothetical protein
MPLMNMVHTLIVKSGMDSLRLRIARDQQKDLWCFINDK